MCSCFFLWYQFWLFLCSVCLRGAFFVIASELCVSVCCCFCVLVFVLCVFVGCVIYFVVCDVVLLCLIGFVLCVFVRCFL